MTDALKLYFFTKRSDFTTILDFFTLFGAKLDSKIQFKKNFNWSFFAVLAVKLRHSVKNSPFFLPVGPTSTVKEQLDKDFGSEAKP